MQCSDGGFGAYEVTRAPQFLESLNAAEVFGWFLCYVFENGLKENTGNVMTEQTYPECTTSVITAFRIFQQYYPEYRKKDIKFVHTLSKGALFTPPLF
jgi:lanosterol synthase